MTRLTLGMPEEAFATLRQSPEELTREMRVPAAVKWHELGWVSGGRGAELAGLTRDASVAALSEYTVTLFQHTEAELRAEVRGAE